MFPLIGLMRLILVYVLSAEQGDLALDLYIIC